MLLPIGDTPNPRGIAWVTWGLIAANVAAFLSLWPLTQETVDGNDPRLLAYLQAVAADRDLGLSELRTLARQVSAYDLLVFDYGFRPGHASLLSALSSMFLHGGLAHIAGNMLFLWIYGDNVEHRLGRARFLLFYLGAGLLGAAGDALLRPDSPLPTVGASGAISGVLGAYFVLFPDNLVRVWVFFFPIYMNVVEISARWVLGFYLVVQNLLPALLGGGGGVSYGAHLGGFALGLGVAGLLRVGDRGVGEVWVGTAGEVVERAGGRGAAPASASKLARDFLAGRMASSGLDAAGVVLLVESLEQRGDEALALATTLRGLALWPHDAHTPRLLLAATRLLLSNGRTTEAFPYLQRASQLAESAEDRAELMRLAVILRARTRRLPRGAA